jgi:hypothetical protein
MISYWDLCTHPVCWHRGLLRKHTCRTNFPWHIGRKEHRDYFDTKHQKCYWLYNLWMLKLYEVSWWQLVPKHFYSFRCCWGCLIFSCVFPHSLLSNYLLIPHLYALIFAYYMSPPHCFLLSTEEDIFWHCGWLIVY